MRARHWEALSEKIGMYWYQQHDRHTLRFIRYCTILSSVYYHHITVDTATFNAVLCCAVAERYIVIMTMA
jgi:hypothetical protein